MHLFKDRQYHEIILMWLIQIPEDSFGLSSSVLHAYLFSFMSSTLLSLILSHLPADIIDTQFEMDWEWWQMAAMPGLTPKLWILKTQLYSQIAVAQSSLE